MFKLVNGSGAEVNSQQEADLCVGIFGSNSTVLQVGEKCRAEIMSGNVVRVYDGEIISQGRRYNQPYGEYVDFTLDNGNQGEVRYDIIGLKFVRNSEGNEYCETFVRKGIQESGAVEVEDIREGASASYVPLYRVKISGLNIESVEALFSTVNPLTELARQVALMMHPIGAIYISTDPSNPSEYFGGTWIAWGAGKVPVGVDASQAEFNTVERTGGEKSANLSHSHTVNAHSHTVNAHSHIVNSHKHLAPSGYDEGRYYAAQPYGSNVIGQNPGYYFNGGNGGRTGMVRLNYTSESSPGTSNSAPGTSNASPGTDSRLSAQSLLQPYITCYMWKRIA